MKKTGGKVPNATESITTSRYENKKSQNKGKIQVKKENCILELGKRKIPGTAKLRSMYTSKGIMERKKKNLPPFCSIFPAEQKLSTAALLQAKHWNGKIRLELSSNKW